MFIFAVTAHLKIGKPTSYKWMNSRKDVSRTLANAIISRTMRYVVLKWTDLGILYYNFYEFILVAYIL